MTPRDFCYWLQGYIELTDASISDTLLEECQVDVIRDHLKLVFEKETPDRQRPLTDYMQYADGVSVTC